MRCGLRSLLVVLCAVLLFASQAFCAEPPSPKSVIDGVIEQLVKAVETYPAPEQEAVRHAKLREIFNPHFNFLEMSKRALGSEWPERTEAEQKEFVSVFSELLAKTYLKKVENIQRGTVKLESEEIKLPKALVRSKITYKNDVFPLDYKLLLQEGKWGVYDIVIENVGLVANYQTEFAGIIRKDGFPGLITKLQEKVAAK